MLNKFMKEETANPKEEVRTYYLVHGSTHLSFPPKWLWIILKDKASAEAYMDFDQSTVVKDWKWW